MSNVIDYEEYARLLKDLFCFLAIFSNCFFNSLEIVNCVLVLYLDIVMLSPQNYNNIKIKC